MQNHLLHDKDGLTLPVSVFGTSYQGGSLNAVVAGSVVPAAILDWDLSTQIMHLTLGFARIQVSARPPPSKPGIACTSPLSALQDPGRAVKPPILLHRGPSCWIRACSPCEQARRSSAQSGFSMLRRLRIQKHIAIDSHGPNGIPKNLIYWSKMSYTTK